MISKLLRTKGRITMAGFRNERTRTLGIWLAACVLVLFLSFTSIAIPQASAQAASGSQDDAKRYSQLLQSIYQFILQNYVDQVDPAVLYEGAMKGMFNALGDPHSVFLDADMLSDLMRETDGTYAGVGLYISKQPGAAGENDAKYVEVVSPIEDTPAWKAGILPGDLILKIDGENTAELTVDQASNKIRGPAGTKVILTFRRGTSYEFDVEFTRATIEIPSIKTGSFEQNGAKYGYIRIIEWIPQTPDKIQEALSKLVKEGVSFLIVDVRSNPGGLLSSVVDVSDLFIDSGVIVSTKGRNKQENFEYKAKPGVAVPASVKMIVMVNKGSASASEIFAGAMKDTRRALLLGEKTYGKGSVQQIFPLDKIGFKLTMARYYTPSGVNIDKTGIEPDVSVPDLVLSEKQMAVYEKLYTSGLIQKFAESNPNAGKAERKAYAEHLISAEGFDIPQVFIEKMLRDEAEKTKPARVFDLEFDVQLQEAVRILASPDFDSMLKNSKTVEQLLSAKPDTGAVTQRQ